MEITSSYHVLTIIGFLLLACQSEPINPAEIQNEINIIPIPSSTVSSEGNFILNEATAIFTGESNNEISIANQLREILSRSTGFELPVRTGTYPKEATNICLQLSDNPNFGEEGYELVVAKNLVSIKSLKSAGLFYGVQTLRQLLPAAIESSEVQTDLWKVPAVTITDKPRFGFRGAMLDVARHFFEAAEVKKYIDLLSYYKIDTLHLHLTDDQGWRIEIDSWPELTDKGGLSSVNNEKGGYYTKADYAEIVAFARDRFITIIPEIDLPGHTNAALSSYATLNCDGSATEPYFGIEVGFSSLCIEKEITYQFIDDVVREVSEMTPGPYFHIGGDEAKTTQDEDYVAFIDKVGEIVLSYGR